VSETRLVEWQIVPLSRDYDRSKFSCGQSELDDWLQKSANQSQGIGYSRTYIAVRTGDRAVAGYYALAVSSVEFEHLSEEHRKRLPRHPVPVMLLARLAVDRTSQRQGVGGFLLADSIDRTLRMSEEAGIHTMAVDAMTDDAKTFYEKNGFEPLLDDRRHLFLSLKAARRAQERAR